MKAKSTPKDLTLIQLFDRFGTDEKARQHLERVLWNGGIVCPHCKCSDQKQFAERKANPEKKIRAGLRYCSNCKSQFTVTAIRTGPVGYNEMGDSHMGLQARLMSQALRKLTGTVSKSRTCLIFINQIREKIGVMFGNPETTTGGRALKFYSSVRVDIRRIAAIKEGDVVTGSRTKVKVVKNKVAAPFREAEFDILYGEGISREGDLLDLAVNNNILEKSGSWFSYKGERIGQGRENARQFLKDNKDTMAKLDAEVRKALGLIAAPRTDAGANPAADRRPRHHHADGDGEREGSDRGRETLNS